MVDTISWEADRELNGRVRLSPHEPSDTPSIIRVELPDMWASSYDVIGSSQYLLWSVLAATTKKKKKNLNIIQPLELTSLHSKYRRGDIVKLYHKEANIISEYGTLFRGTSLISATSQQQWAEEKGESCPRVQEADTATKSHMFGSWFEQINYEKIACFFKQSERFY